VFVADYGDKGVADASRYARGRLQLPHPESAEAEFVSALLARAEDLGGALLLPGTDEALVALARNKALLESAFVVGTPEWSVVKRVIEKHFTYDLAQSLGVAIPRTVHPASMRDVDDFASRAEFPCVVKPSQSHLFVSRFGRKMFAASDAGQMRRLYAEATDAGLDVVLQEFVPGPDSNGANYNSYRCDGRIAVEFTARKVRNAPPSYGSPCVVVSSSVPVLRDPAERLLDALRLEGFSCTEFKLDERDGTYKLMEVNARHNLSGSLAVRCGVDFPWLQYQHALYGEPPARSSYPKGVYWIDLPRDAAHVLQDLRQGIPLRDLARPYLGPHVFAVASARDPLPFLKRLSHILGVVGERLLRWPRRHGD
jgi:predicted ATP-grasp superfamily ATP-dependent carboligase